MPFDDGSILTGTAPEAINPSVEWFAAGILLFASAASAAVSIHLLWLPCRGSMLNASLFATREIKELTDACLTRMDTGFPFLYWPEQGELSLAAAELGGLAMVLAAASWIVLILGLRLRRETRWTALVAAVAPTLFAVLNWTAAVHPDRGLDAYISGWLWIAVDAVAVAVFLVLSWRNRDRRSGILLGLAFVLWGATAFGMAHLLMDYAGMLAFNQNNWDTPPGTGWITVAVLMIAGSVSFRFGGRRHETPTVAYAVSPAP